MKFWLCALLALCLLLPCAAFAAENETTITLGDDLFVNGALISENADAPVYLAHVNETHPGVSEACKDVTNRVITITQAGTYRVSGEAFDTQIAVCAGEHDSVRLILDNMALSCRTAPAIIGVSGYDPRVPGEYGLTIELAEGSDNFITGSHTVSEDDATPEYDGAIGTQLSLGFEGTGRLTIDADNEGIEVASGHMTINGGEFFISACDDPLNVSEDGVGTLTINDGFLYSAVKPLEGGEGDGADSNGSIVFNGGTSINLAHPDSQDSGIDADMGASINGGIVVGAGNMYDPISSDSQQLFMMLEFSDATDQLVVVTDENDQPVFAYDFPHDYMYIAFSTPELREGAYHVYLGGAIAGTQTNGLYTEITAYTPGTRMQHGAGTAMQRGGFGMNPPEGMEFPEGMDRGERQAPPEGMEIPEGMGHGERQAPPEGMEFPEGMEIPEGMEHGERPTPPDGMEIPEGMNPGPMPHGMTSSSDTATDLFMLTRDQTGFTNVRAAEPAAQTAE